MSSMVWDFSVGEKELLDRVESDHPMILGYPEIQETSSFLRFGRISDSQSPHPGWDE